MPILHEAVVQQTHAIIGDTVNEEHRLWMLSARTKILLAQSFEEGLDLYNRFKPYLLGVLTDTEFPRKGKLDPEAGVIFLQKIKAELPELPMLLLSSEKSNQEAALRINTLFQDKNSPSLHVEIRKFLVKHLGFGDFVFRMPDGREVGRVSTLRDLELALAHLPEESLKYHLFLNHFSNWLMARSEIYLAARFRTAKSLNLKGVEQIRAYLINNLKQQRMLQQRGLVIPFNAKSYDSEFDMLRIGDGSLGGKARGLAFMARFLQENMDKLEKYANIKVMIPKGLIIATDHYDRFIEENNLQDFAQIKCPDEDISRRFLGASLAEPLLQDLRVFLAKNKTPLAIRSSSLLEDSRDQPYAGMYSTYMLSNNHDDPAVRLEQLQNAIKLTYASVFFESPKAFSKTTKNRTEEEKMAVLIQPVTGRRHGDFFYPAISGTVQSYNYYPIDRMLPEEGAGQISLGMGKIVVEGGQSLRFSPYYPQSLYQFSSVDDILDNAQKHFYAISLKDPSEVSFDQDTNLVKRAIYDAMDEEPVKMLASTYYPSDHRIRDTFSKTGAPILTFANILKYESFPLAAILRDMILIGRKGFGCDIELEFAVNLPTKQDEAGEFILLQARPLNAPTADTSHVDITAGDIEKAFCYSPNVLGFGLTEQVSDIVFVKCEDVSSRNTVQVVRQIAHINSLLAEEGRKYILIGPGRWGSRDHCLGIPVAWQDIAEVVGIVETGSDTLKADPSQGTHFFQNLTSLGITYFSIHHESSFLKWDWIRSLPVTHDLENVSHVRLPRPLVAKINGRKGVGVLTFDESQ